MIDDAHLTLHITVQVRLPKEGEGLDGYLQYCESAITDGLKPQLAKGLTGLINEYRNGGKMPPMLPPA